MNSIYDSTDPIWFEFYNTLPIEDKLDLQQQAKRSVNGFNPIINKYNFILNEEINNGFPLVKEIYENDFQINPFYEEIKKVDLESIKALFTSLRKEDNEFEFPMMKFKSFRTPGNLEVGISLVCYKDELIHKAWCEENINRKIRKKILRVLIAKKNLSKLDEWITTGIINVSPSVHLPFSKVFSDKTLIKCFIYMCYFNGQYQLQAIKD